ncbi:MAG: hypothetical protein AAF412_03650 [Pseudomonadota bacterium]
MDESKKSTDDWQPMYLTILHGIDPVRAYRWRPREDITVYELASAIPFLLTSNLRGFEDLIDEVKRHFAEVE